MGNPGSIPGLGRTPEKGMASGSSILSWDIPRTEEPGGLQSVGLQRGEWLSDSHTRTPSCAQPSNTFPLLDPLDHRIPPPAHGEGPGRGESLTYTGCWRGQGRDRQVRLYSPSHSFFATWPGGSGTTPVGEETPKSLRSRAEPEAQARWPVMAVTEEVPTPLRLV